MSKGAARLGPAYPEDVLAQPLHHDGVGAVLPRLPVLGRFAVQTEIMFNLGSYEKV
jgi:hypothetical protein